MGLCFEPRGRRLAAMIRFDASRVTDVSLWTSTFIFNATFTLFYSYLYGHLSINLRNERRRAYPLKKRFSYIGNNAIHCQLGHLVARCYIVIKLYYIRLIVTLRTYIERAGQLQLLWTNVDFIISILHTRRCDYFVNVQIVRLVDAFFAYISQREKTKSKISSKQTYSAGNERDKMKSSFRLRRCPSSTTFLSFFLSFFIPRPKWKE